MLRAWLSGEDLQGCVSELRYRHGVQISRRHDQPRLGAYVSVAQYLWGSSVCGMIGTQYFSWQYSAVPEDDCSKLPGRSAIMHRLQYHW